MNRSFQYGLKFWFGTSAVMAVCLSLSADEPAIQLWRPLYLLITVVVVTSQKVDATLSKGVLRIVVTIFGGTYGTLPHQPSKVQQNLWCLSAMCTSPILPAPTCTLSLCMIMPYQLARSEFPCLLCCMMFCSLLPHVVLLPINTHCGCA